MDDSDPVDEQAGNHTIDPYLQRLLEQRDRSVPGSPEEEQAAIAILDFILSGGRPPSPLS
jgi:hypothetical protein